MFVACAAMRLARFNIQSASGGDKRYFVGMPSPAAAAIPAATVFAYPWGLYDYRAALPALAMVLVPAVLMVSTIRFRSFKTLDSQGRKPYTVLIFVAAGIMLIATHPRFTLVAMAYSYLASAFIGMAITRFKHRGGAWPRDGRRCRVHRSRQRGSVGQWPTPPSSRGRLRAGGWSPGAPRRRSARLAIGVQLAKRERARDSLSDRELDVEKNRIVAADRRGVVRGGAFFPVVTPGAAGRGVARRQFSPPYLRRVSLG